MDNSWMWLSGLVIGPLVVAAWEQYSHSKDEDFKFWSQRENLPEELKTAKLFMSEQDISCRSPALHGTPDQVFETADGRLIPVDTKTRQHNRVYKSDVIQLSVYRTILSKKYSTRNIAEYGYVRLVVDNPAYGRKIRYAKVMLMSESEIVRLLQSYWSIRKGKVIPTCTCSGKMCTGN